MCFTISISGIAATMESDEDEDTGRMRTLRDEDGSKKSSRRGKKTSKKGEKDDDVIEE